MCQCKWFFLLLNRKIFLWKIFRVLNRKNQFWMNHKHKLNKLNFLFGKSYKYLKLMCLLCLVMINFWGNLSENQCLIQFRMILIEVCFDMINNLKILILIKNNKNMFLIRIECKCHYYYYYFRCCYFYCFFYLLEFVMNLCYFLRQFF